MKRLGLVQFSKDEVKEKCLTKIQQKYGRFSIVYESQMQLSS